MLELNNYSIQKVEILTALLIIIYTIVLLIIYTITLFL